jgi:hypothetical protein
LTTTTATTATSVATSQEHVSPSPADIAVAMEERDALRRVAARWLHARLHGAGLGPADMASELEELGISINNELHGAELICDLCDTEDVW